MTDPETTIGSETREKTGSVPSFGCTIEFYRVTVCGRTQARRHFEANTMYQVVSGDGVIYQTIQRESGLEWHIHLLEQGEIVYTPRQTAYFFQAIGEEPLVLDWTCCSEQATDSDVEIVAEPDPNAVIMRGSILAKVVEVEEGRQIVVELPDGKQTTFLYSEIGWEPGMVLAGSMVLLELEGKPADYLRWGLTDFDSSGITANIATPDRESPD